MSSNTTDNSVMQSDDLEDVSMMIENKQLSTESAVYQIVEFAQNKMKLNLNHESLLEKVQAVNEQVDFKNIRDSINNMKEVDIQISDLDKRIKVIYNRCQNELKPILKAIEKSETNILT